MNYVRQLFLKSLKVLLTAVSRKSFIPASLLKQNRAAIGNLRECERVLQNTNEYAIFATTPFPQ